MTQVGPFVPLHLVVEAKDSHGEAVSPKQITMEGSVDLQVPGEYPILLQFIDPYTETPVKAMTMVTVVRA
ncbi:bacterial Ig-like domain-containing protein [Furfurilactobacillus curtus]|uniref:bacterial Ig-like domain-containing protein n=1 Tax=Furfurilactobacillus curtus TaxID=1746200 RepID=UPI0038B3893D